MEEIKEYYVQTGEHIDITHAVNLFTGERYLLVTRDDGEGRISSYIAKEVKIDGIVLTVSS
jgi:hypothetical protein